MSDFITTESNDPCWCPSPYSMAQFQSSTPYSGNQGFDVKCSWDHRLPLRECSTCGMNLDLQQLHFFIMHLPPKSQKSKIFAWEHYPSIPTLLHTLDGTGTLQSPGSKPPWLCWSHQLCCHQFFFELFKSWCHHCIYFMWKLWSMSYYFLTHCCSAVLLLTLNFT